MTQHENLRTLGEAGFTGVVIIGALGGLETLAAGLRWGLRLGPGLVGSSLYAFAVFGLLGLLVAVITTGLVGLRSVIGGRAFVGRSRLLALVAATSVFVFVGLNALVLANYPLLRTVSLLDYPAWLRNSVAVLIAALAAAAAFPVFSGLSRRFEGGRPAALAIGVLLASVSGVVLFRGSGVLMSGLRLQFSGRAILGLIPRLGWTLLAGVLGYALARWLYLGWEVWRREQKHLWRWLALPLGLVLVVAIALAVSVLGKKGSSLPATTPAEDAPNVILISIDALRPDHLSCYGYPAHTSPHIDSLAELGVTFRQAVSVATFTSGSVASFLTSTYPCEHGVRANGETLKPSSVTLAEALKLVGYRTGGVSANRALRADKGFSQGFDFYELPGENRWGFLGRLLLYRILNTYSRIRDIGARSVTEAAIDWVGRHRQERFFLWLHYMDTHGPQVAPPQYLQRFGVGDFAGDRFWGGVVNLREGQRRVMLEGMNPAQKLSSPELERQRAVYDAGLAYADDQIGVLVDKLKEWGIFERTLVIITADHGEALGERNQVGHAHVPYENALRVPLILCCPSRLPHGETRNDLVCLLDLMPTVLEAAGIRLPLHLAGRSVWTRERTGEARGRVVYTEGTSPDAYFLKYYPTTLPGVMGKVRTLRTERWKLIYWPRQGEHHWELYDLRADPLEARDSYAEQADTARAYQTMLIAHLLATEGVSAGAGSEMDRETKEDLRALGYME
jgi:arylsulfatase A-like enzyme